jgi:hypothetical protein
MTDRSDHARTSRSTHEAFHALMVIGLVIAFGVFFALTLRLNQSVSELENRRLAIWPTFTSQALLDGSYTRDIEKYVSDHFPGRRWFTEMAFSIRTYRGLHTGDRVIQVKGADTGFEDVSKWASVTETTASDESDAPIQPNETHDSKTPTDAETTGLSSSVANEQPVASKQPVAIEQTVASEQPIQAASIQTNAEQETAAITPSIETHESNAPQSLEKEDSTEKPTQHQMESVVKAESPAAEKPVEVKPAAVKPAVVNPTAVNPVSSNSTPAKPPVVAQSTPAASTQSKPLNVVGGVLLHEGQALFMFQGTDRGAQGYANAVNTWVELVANKRQGMTSTVVVTPTSSHFYLPQAARARTTSEPKNLAAMRAALLPEVRFADVVSEMEGHQDEALFFKSDHHWTGLGAYYAYRAWARVNGVTPLELSSFSKRSVPGVAGSFWSLTQAPELRNADKESYYYVPTTVTFDGTQYTGPQQKSPVPQPFFAEKSRGYIVFLGGDIPLLVSNTSAGTGRTALVVKNSYGNAFAPYLLPHFDRVVVLDYRYVSRNIQDIVDTFGVTDLVFVNATITANSGAHQERMRQVARGSSNAWLTEAEKRRNKQQEDAAAKAQASAGASDTAQ